MVKIRRNDTVLVQAGKDKGKRGRILRIKPSDGTAWVQGINMVKKAMRPKPNVRQAGIIEREAPINLSNLRLVCPSCDRPTRALLGPDPQPGAEAQPGARSRKTRVCKLCQEIIE
ncbi:MAG: 50S ribosomal protein L24 [Chloroflexi bacterium]|nr:50S ribosomal protein L24 [Chloroflexota bacterium]